MKITPSQKNTIDRAKELLKNRWNDANFSVKENALGQTALYFSTYKATAIPNRTNASIVIGKLGKVVVNFATFDWFKMLIESTLEID